MPETTEDLERWRALRASFEDVTDPRQACPLPTTTDIERFQTDTGFRLPASFRGFTRVFGPGVLVVGDEGIRCSAARAPEASYDLRRRVLESRQEMAKPFLSGVLGPRLLRLVVFANDAEGDLYGWDPEDLTDPDAPEYGVYYWRHEEDQQAVKLTRTFEGFIRLLTNPTEYRKRKRARASKPDIADPTFGYFEKPDGSEVTGSRGRPLLRQFIQRPGS